MHRVIDMPLEGGGSLLMEVAGDEDRQDGMVHAARGGGLAASAEVSFEQAVDRVRPAAEAMIERLRDIASRPDEITVTFGLKMSAKAGALIAASALEANFAVELRWTQA
jgi:Trypsin-co-occurring domain 1